AFVAFATAAFRLSTPLVLATPECACPAPPERTETRFTIELLPVLVSHTCIALHSLFPELGRAPRPKPERPVEQWKAVRPYRSDKLLDSFTMQREVQPVALDFLGHAQADRKVDDLEDDRGTDAAEHHGHD